MQVSRPSRCQRYSQAQVDTVRTPTPNTSKGRCLGPAIASVRNAKLLLKMEPKEGSCTAQKWKILNGIFRVFSPVTKSKCHPAGSVCPARTSCATFEPTHPPHPTRRLPCKNNSKSTGFDANNTYCCFHTGVVCARGEKTQAIRAKQSIIEVVSIMSLEAHGN